jgi:hypothetical protein
MMLYPIASLGKDLRVEWVDCYGDGTVTAGITDSEGRQTHVCIDGRTNSPTRHRLFEQARHPRKDGAVLVELGAPVEGIVVPLLSRWLDLDEARESRKELTERGIEMVQEALLHFGEPAEW